MSGGGALSGLFLGCGLVLVFLRIPLARRISLVDRIAPYVEGAVPSEALAGTIARRAERAGWRAVVRELSGRLDGLVGGGASVRRRLAALGSDRTVEDFRHDQVLWAAGACGAGALLLAVRLSAGAGPPALSLFGLTVLGVVAGPWARDQALTRAVSRRRAAIALELPAVAELLALAVGAGESPHAALERVSRRGSGELARDVRAVLADTRAGMSFHDALAGLAQRTAVPALHRFADGLTVAVQRGTPLADVLRAQAVDVREASRRALIESGGKREIAMMAPVVFLILPVTLLFALFPGAVTLTSIAH